MRVGHGKRGFLVQAASISLATLAVNGGGATESDYEQASPRPGEIEAADALSVYLPRVHGEMDADLDLYVIRAGAPRVDGAGAIYREDGQTDGAWRGWCEPNWLTGYVPVEWSSTEDWTDVDAVTIPSTQAVVAVASDRDGTAPESVSVWRRERLTRAWGSRVEPDPDNIRDLSTIWCRKRDERLVVFQSAAASGQLVAQYSDDAGDTWASYSTALHTGSINSTATRIRVVADRSGALLLLVSAASDGDCWSFVSTDDGGTFEPSDDEAARMIGQSLALLPNGRILVCYVDQATTRAMALTLEDAADRVSLATGAEINGSVQVSRVECAIDGDGIVYVLAQKLNSDEWYCARSIDNGDTWEAYTYGPIARGGATTPTNHRTRPHAATFSGGELVVLATSNHTATSPATDGSLLGLTFGGWVDLEQSDGQGTRVSRQSWGDDALLGNAWLPGETLANQSWTATGTAETLSAGMHRFNPAAATSYATLITTRIAGARSDQFELQVASGGGAADQCAVLISRRNAPNAYTLRVEATTTAIRLVDANGGPATIGTVALDLTEVLQVMLIWGSTESSVTLYYKRRGDSLWTKGPQTTALTAGVTANTDDLWRVGCLSATTSDLRVGLIAWSGQRPNTTLSDDVSGGTTYTQKLRWGKSLGARPYYTRDQGGLAGAGALSAVGGPARIGEAFDASRAYDYPAAHLLPQENPSPSSGWRSLTQGEQRLVWDLGADGRLPGSGWSLGLALLRANFRTAILEARAAADVAWSTIGTYDGAVGVGVSFARQGTVLQALASGAAGTSTIGPSDLRGGLVILDPGGANVERRIRDNTGGGFGPGINVRAILELEGIDGTEPTSGACHVIAPSGVLLVHGRTTPYRYLQLRIPAQSTAESRFELGQVLLGGLFVPGMQWSRGWSWRTTSRIVRQVDAQGTAWASVVGEALQEELTVSWQDGHDLSAHRQGPGALYLSQLPGAPGLVTVGDVWLQLRGLMRASEGQALPVVALASIPEVEGRTILDPTLFLAGLMSGPLQNNNVLGEEGSSELSRTESLTVTGLL